MLERGTYDFGRIEAGQQSVARIGIKNTGPKELVLSTISSPCYCVGYRGVPPTIKPGQSAIIELVYSQRTVGADTQEIKLASNDLNGDAKLTLKANVVKDLVPTSLVKESGSLVPFK